MQKNQLLASLSTPYYLIYESKLLHNLSVLKHLQEKANIKVLYSLKSFANTSLLPIIFNYLHGGSASSLYEAILINQYSNKKAHTYNPAFKANEFEQIAELSNYIIFNSLNQYKTFYKSCITKGINIGLRINPEYSEIESSLYNPALPGSRFGIIKSNMPQPLPEYISGLHFHSLSENNHQTAEKVINKVIEKFHEELLQIKWLNIGGGYLITSDEFDIENFIQFLLDFKQKYPNLELFMEPGEAITYKAGILATSVIDIVENNGITNAILDISFRNHAPYYVFMPRAPIIINIPETNNGKYIYRLAGCTCMTGDYINNKLYSFATPLKIGDKLLLEDMIHYTIVDNTMFNGIKTPDIYYLKQNNNIQLLKHYTFNDFISRIG